MRNYFFLMFLVLNLFGFSQQYDSVVFETVNVDENNEIYKIGNLFIYDYEIIQNGTKYKLKKNSDDGLQKDFQLAPIDSDSIGVDKIHMIIPSLPDSEKMDPSQTMIIYIQIPIVESISSTNVAENEHNVWIHPIRSAFFNSLETAPFPYIKKPYIIGLEWSDQMVIGRNWGNELWGKWEGDLLLTYHYKLIDKTILKTEMGDLDCYKIESIATSRIGNTKLTFYFSEKYGFIRYEYELMKNLKINMWLIDFQTGKEFNHNFTILQTKEYLKK